jgi:hypothetical protein
LSVTGEFADIWCLRLSHSWLPGERLLRRPIDGVDSWNAVRTALPQALPLSWRPFDAVPLRPPEPRWLTGTSRTLPAALRGNSYSLAFAISQASLLLAEPPAPEVCATAAVCPDGTLEGVHGLELKVQLLLHKAPGLRTLLVSAGQVDSATRFANRLWADALATGTHAGHLPLQVKGCSTVGEALALAIPDAVTHWQQRSPSERRGQAIDLFRLAISPSNASSAWAPVRRAAELALEAWPDLTEPEHARLSFARAIAARHDGETLPLDAPAASLFSALPQPLRVDHVSHVVQHAADTGAPDPASCEKLARNQLPSDLSDAFPSHLRLMGALGRLLANLGRH